MAFGGLHVLLVIAYVVIAALMHFHIANDNKEVAQILSVTGIVLLGVLLLRGALADVGGAADPGSSLKALSY